MVRPPARGRVTEQCISGSRPSDDFRRRLDFWKLLERLEVPRCRIQHHLVSRQRAGTRPVGVRLIAMGETAVQSRAHRLLRVVPGAMVAGPSGPRGFPVILASQAMVAFRVRRPPSLKRFYCYAILSASQAKALRFVHASARSCPLYAHVNNYWVTS